MSIFLFNKQFNSFNGKTKFPEKERERVQKEIDDKGPIDLYLLGLGRNGYLGFIEPAVSLFPHYHVAKLSLESLQHQMIGDKIKKPSMGSLWVWLTYCSQRK